MHCPTCKHDTVVAVQNPEENYHALRKCMNCGFSWYPLRIPYDQFMAREMEHRKHIEEIEAIQKEKIQSMEKKL